MLDPILDIFREEAIEHFSALESGFLDLEAAQDAEGRRPIINSLFRHAHSLKGDARVIGLEDLQSVAQQLEEILDTLRHDPALVTPVQIDQGLRQLDLVRQSYDAWNRSLAGDSESLQAPLVASDPDSIGSNREVDERFAVRVPSDRLDRMLNLVGETRIIQRSRVAVTSHLADLRRQLEALSEARAELTAQEVDTALDAVRRVEHELRTHQMREQLLVEELEDDIQQARLLPLSRLADSLRRAVRDLARTLGKEIRYDINVGQILLDKGVIESLKTPLLHLVRNAADHGIESPERRQAAGKPPEGSIRIEARQRGELVQIRLIDDGAGIKTSLLRSQVRNRFGMSHEEFDSLAPEQQWAFLFQPGFSTSDVGSVSGRGVGLDVVRDTLLRLHGKVEIAASSPAGTTFLLTVPVSISTLRAVTVWTGGEPYGVPSVHIQKAGKVLAGALRSLEGERVIMLQGNPVRWIWMREFLGTQGLRRGVSEEEASYLLISRNGESVAVGVDEVDEEREILLKPLGFPMNGLPGVLGGTIRPDGAVQIVVDLSELAFHRDQTSKGPVERRATPGRVLVVDDSPTTRAILRHILTAAGLQVTTAIDGLDALDKLKGDPVDLVVSDFEMPRLNGVDLTRRIKAKYRIPVILVTGRESEAHRREGLEAGADAYVVKSTFEGAGLLDVVRQFV